MTEIPKTMRALAAPKAGRPDGYEIMEVPTPTITEPTQVLLRVHAATIDTGETQIIDGMMWPLHTPRYGGFVSLSLGLSHC